MLRTLVAFLPVAVVLSFAPVLIVLGVQSLRGHAAATRPAASSGRALRDGVITSISNPKLGVFYVALFPQFVPARWSRGRGRGASSA